MVEVLALAEIKLWGATVGGVAELDDGRVVFEYAEEFRRSGLEISPIHLPLSRRGPQSFEELRRKDAFRGLPGVLADALPDAFGNKVMRAWFTSRGEAQRALSPVQRLLYVGERALGALTFHPAQEIPMRAAERESLELAALVRDARRIVQGSPDIAIPEIYRIGASAGGMRPKALVLYDLATGTIRSGHAEPRAGEVRCLLKFDGVGDEATVDELGRPQPHNRVEAAYGAMARAAGLETTQITVLESSGHAHLLVHRFDVEEGRRIHQHTFGGMVHVDYNEVGASSYEEYLRTVLALGMPHASVEEAFRRMVFNVFAVNQDDHVKNLSFQMLPEGRWRLAPAYDLTFARGAGWTARHQMRIQDKVEQITIADLHAVASTFAIRHVERILGAARTAIARWEEFAGTFAVPKEVVQTVRSELDRRARELAA